MTKLLEQIITQIEKLPEVEQNRILNELQRENTSEKAIFLDDVISLVEQWLAEDSKYDEEVYPQLEVALFNNSVSIQANLLNE